MQEINCEGGVFISYDNSSGCVSPHVLTETLSYMMGWLIMLVFLSALAWYLVSHITDILSHYIYWRKHPEVYEGSSKD